MKKAKESKLRFVDERSIRLARADGRKCTERLIAEIHENFNGTGVKAVLSGSYKLSILDAIEKGAIALGVSLANAYFERMENPTVTEQILDQLGGVVEEEASNFFDEYRAEHHYVKNQMIRFTEWPKWDSRDKITVIDRAVTGSHEILLTRLKEYRSQIPSDEKIAHIEAFIKERTRNRVHTSGENIADEIRIKFGGNATANSVSNTITPKLKELGLRTSTRKGHFFPSESPDSTELDDDDDL